MSFESKRNARRSGFTLPEVLVAVAMVGVLSAVILPSVTGQIAKSETSRVVQDLQNISQGIQSYRTDTGDWPTTVSELVSSSATGWHGPYLASAQTTGDYQTGGGAVIQNALTSNTDCGATFMVVQFIASGDGAPTADLADRIDLQIDAAAAGADGTAGLFQYSSSDPAGSAEYCAVAITQ